MAINSIKGCIGCGDCVKSCPTDVIRIDKRTKKATIVYPADCWLYRSDHASIIGQNMPL